MCVFTLKSWIAMCWRPKLGRKCCQNWGRQHIAGDRWGLHCVVVSRKEFSIGQYSDALLYPFPVLSLSYSYDEELTVIYMTARLAGGYAALRRALNEVSLIWASPASSSCFSNNFMNGSTAPAIPFLGVHMCVLFYVCISFCIVS